MKLIKEVVNYFSKREFTRITDWETIIYFQTRKDEKYVRELFEHELALPEIFSKFMAQF